MRCVLPLAVLGLVFMSGNARAQGFARAALAQEIRFEGIYDHRTTLEQVLLRFRDRHKVPLVVNEVAFMAEQLMDVLKTEVAIVPLEPMETQVYYALKQVLRRLPAPSGATLIVRGNTVEVTTTRAAMTERGVRPEPSPPPSRTLRLRLIRAQAFLSGPINFAGIDDPKTTLQELLKELEKKHGIQFEIDERVFSAEQVMDVLGTQVARDRPLPPLNNVPGSQVLSVILARIPAPSGAGYLLWSRGTLEITTGDAVRSGSVFLVR